ncbi:hypothetical protein EI42_04076 [Thermosporothrix hazakensis]|uniref:V8-like Glu-specific endopeptidase n=2 Tax=Thermosporothrix hazakensis TaxID=644383 RepID=A0A326U4L3_THEHA|nr:hypothetical protein EI42_04076 [Thermosporothrix hazakensis]
MRRNSSRRWCFLLFPGVLALVCALLLSDVGTTARAANTSTSGVSMKEVTQDPKAVADYWTPERMRTAKPADIILPEKKQPVSTRPGILAATAVPTGSYGTFPYSTIGKVFFTDPRTGSNYVCSGTAVQSQNGSTVDTAGHCVAAGGENRYYTNWAFCPQYIDGSCPKGRWTARRLLADSVWLSSGALYRDYGAAVVNTLNGQTLVAAVNGVQFGANLSRTQTWYALGYPAASPFNGNRMYQCISGRIADDSGTPQPIGISCNMTGGCSGGGWLINVNGTWYVNGHNDYKYGATSNNMYSPYYGNEALNVYNTAQIA